VAMGEGEAVLGGERLPGGEALRRAGIEPVRLAPKDGLTVISANGVAVGWAALVVDRAQRLADAADLVAAMSMEAMRGNPSIVDPVAAAVKPVAGQEVSAARLRRLLEGSRLATSDGAASVQDPLSFRVAPQVHGAFRETVQFAVAAVDQELAAMDDNPLVSIAEDRMISNGNFHPMLLALAVDAIRPALAHLAQLADRRTGQVWDFVAGDQNAFTPSGIEEMLRFGSPLLRYAGAARMAELRTLASPATLDVPVLDRGVEDHATNAPLAVRRTAEALELAESVLTVELLTASAAVGWRPETRSAMAPPTRAMLERVASAIAGCGPAPTSVAIHAAALALLPGPLAEAAGLPAHA
jgi:histidine ammonia-lyase